MSVAFASALKPGGRLAHLRHRPWRRARLLVPQRLDRVDDADRGAVASIVRADRLELGLGHDADAGGRADAPARSRTCSADSSPATQQHRPLGADRAEHGRRQARLADPGLAAEQDDRAGTRPPPSTRSSSAIPVPMRAAAVVSTEASGTTTPAAAPLRRAPLRASSEAGACSTSVANAPQSGQRPNQRACSPPHSPHTYVDRIRAMGSGTVAPRADAERAGIGVPRTGVRTGVSCRARTRAGKGCSGQPERADWGTQAGARRSLPVCPLPSGETDEWSNSEAHLQYRSGSDSRSRAGRRLAATDTFTRTVASGWGTADFGGAWAPEAGTSDFSVNGTTGRVRLGAGGVTRAAFLSATAVDWDVSTFVTLDKVPVGSSAWLYHELRRSTANSSSYRLLARFGPDGATYLSASRVAATAARCRSAARSPCRPSTTAPGSRCAAR